MPHSSSAMRESHFGCAAVRTVLDVVRDEDENEDCIVHVVVVGGGLRRNIPQVYYRVQSTTEKKKRDTIG